MRTRIKKRDEKRPYGALATHWHLPDDFFLKKSGQHRTQMTGLAMLRIRSTGLGTRHRCTPRIQRGSVKMCSAPAEQPYGCERCAQFREQPRLLGHAGVQQAKAQAQANAQQLSYGRTLATYTSGIDARKI